MEAFRVEKEELEVALSKERLESLRLKQELSDGDTRKADLTKACFCCYFTFLIKKIENAWNIYQLNPSCSSLHIYTYE